MTVHPTPIYETLVMGLVAYVLWQLRDRVRPGRAVRPLPRDRGLERFLVEFIRRNDDAALGLTAAQLESLACSSSARSGSPWWGVAAVCCATTRRRRGARRAAGDLRS